MDVAMSSPSSSQQNCPGPLVEDSFNNNKKSQEQNTGNQISTSVPSDQTLQGYEFDSQNKLRNPLGHLVIEGYSKH